MRIAADLWRIIVRIAADLSEHNVRLKAKARAKARAKTKERMERERRARKACVKER